MNDRPPCKGAAVDSASKMPFYVWGGVPAYRIGNMEIENAGCKKVSLNTYLLKDDWFGKVAGRFTDVRRMGEG